VKIEQLFWSPHRSWRARRSPWWSSPLVAYSTSL
jgi:hypothetical protein